MNGAFSAGAAYVLEHGAGGFAQTQKIVSASPGQSLEDGLALVGAPGDDTAAGLDSGSVYAYRIVPAVATYCTAKVNSLGCTPSIGWSGLPSLSSAAPFVIDASLVLNQRNGLLFYGFASSSAPFQGGTMCVASPVRRTGVQGSGGSTAGNDCTGTYAFDFNAWMRSGSDPEILPGSPLFAPSTLVRLSARGYSLRT